MQRASGVSTIRQYLSGIAVTLIDELHLPIVPVLLDAAAEHLLGGLNLPALGYECGCAD